MIACRCLLFLEVNRLEVKEELPTAATLFWAEGVQTGKWRREQQEPWRRQIFEVQRLKQVRGLAGTSNGRSGTLLVLKE